MAGINSRGATPSVVDKCRGSSLLATGKLNERAKINLRHRLAGPDRDI
jgi:hypothetical protein